MKNGLRKSCSVNMNEQGFMVNGDVVENIIVKCCFAKIVKEEFSEPQFTGDKLCANRNNFFHNQLEYFYILPEGILGDTEEKSYRQREVNDEMVAFVYPVNRQNILAMNC